MRCVVGLGSNLGSRRATLRAAVALIRQLPGVELTRVSPIYRSAAVGPPQPDYDNAAVRLETGLSARALLGELHAIEARVGRIRRERWGPRTLDLDILWASESVADAELTVPHPRLRERWFALAPLLDAAPELRGEYGMTLAALELPAGARDTARPLERPVAPARPADSRSGASGDGDCPEDALAEALVSLGRAFGACRIDDAVVVEGADLGGLAVAALQATARGLRPTQVSISPLSGGATRACLFGDRERAAPVWRARTSHFDREGDRHRVTIELDARTTDK